MRSSFDLGSDLVVIPKESNFQTVLQIQKEKSEVAIATAQISAKLSDPDAAMNVRLAERIRQLQQSPPTLIPRGFRKCR